VDKTERYKFKPWLRTKIHWYFILVVTVPLMFTAWLGYRFGWHWDYLVTPVLMTALSWFAFRSSENYLNAIDQIYTVLKHCGRGEFHHRVTHVHALGEVGQLAWELNEFLDYCEAYFRELTMVFVRAGNQDFSRHAFDKGLPGQMKQSVNFANQALASMKKNHEHEKAIRLSYGLHDLNTCNLVSNLKLCQQDMLQVTQTLEDVVAIADANAEAASQSKQGVEEVKEAVREISNKVTAAATIINDLSENSKQVIDSLSIITEIADQTGLLALNASIEAARAGEYGRGFAVVADEVKALSNRTKEAAVDISRVLQSFGSSVEAISKEAVDSVTLAEQMQPVVETFSARFGDFEEAAGKTILSATNAQEVSFSTLVKVDHIIYKQNAYLAVGDPQGKTNESKAISIDNHSCRLGKWYYEGVGRERFSGLPSYLRLEKPHEAVHRSAIQALELAKQDWINNAELIQDILGMMDKMEKASLDVMQVLGDMNSESIEKRQANH